MIGTLRGKITSKKAPFLIIECAGVGYEVEATMNVFTSLVDKGDDVLIYTHLSIRDDAHVLFGFVDATERDLFRTLIKVNGIGPKTAVVMLSGMSGDHLRQAIANGDTSTLVKLPGVGKKTAERIVVELQDKFTGSDASSATGSGSVNAPISAKSEAEEALIALGYKPVEATKMVDAVYADNASSEALIKQALQAKLMK